MRAALSGIGVKITETTPGTQTKTKKGSSEATTSETTSTTVKEPVITYSFPVTYSLPSTHGGVGAEILNTDMALIGKSKERVGKEHVYNFILSNL